MGLTVADSPIFCSGVAGQRLQPCDRQRQVRAALVVGHGVDLVDDQRAHRREHLARPFGRQQDVERLRRGHQNVRRFLAHPLAFGGGCVAGAHRGADGRERDPLRRASFAIPASGMSRFL